MREACRECSIAALEPRNQDCGQRKETDKDEKPTWSSGRDEICFSKAYLYSSVWDAGMNQKMEVRKQWSLRSKAGVGRGSKAATSVLVQRQENPVKLLLGKKKHRKDMKIMFHNSIHVCKRVFSVTPHRQSLLLFSYTLNSICKMYMIYHRLRPRYAVCLAVQD